MRQLAGILSEVDPSSGRCLCPRLKELRVAWFWNHDQSFTGRSTTRPPEAPFSLWRTPGLPLWYESSTHVLSTFCEILRTVLSQRAAAKSPLRRLRVRVRPDVVSQYTDKESWEPSVL